MVLPVDAPPFAPIAVDCPYRAIFEHVTSKWGTLVLIQLSRGTHRWAELRRALDGVTEKMLAQTLRILEADGFVVREALPVVPPHVEYSLTPAGLDAVRHLLPLLEYLRDHVDATLEQA